MFGPSSVRADINNDLPSFVWLIPITLLLVALLALSDVYYTLLRLAVFLSAVVVAQFTWSKNVLWRVTLIGVALLYNPVLTIHFTREIWAPINIVTATLYAAHWLIVGRKTRRAQTNAMPQ